MSLSDPNFPAADNAVLAGARERVDALLAERLGDGTLSSDEFEARRRELQSAKTASELNRLMRDLVGPPAAVATAAERYASSIAAPFDGNALAVGAQPTGRLIAILGETKRKGRWVVPHRLEMRVMLGEVLIDVREADLPMGEIELALVGVLGRVRVLVPPGVVVDSTMDSILATVRNDTEHGEVGRYGATVIRLTGAAVLTEVLVRVAPAGEPAERAWKRAKVKRRRD